VNQPRIGLFFWLLVLLIIGGYLYYINLYAVNIPITDDYDLVRVKYTLLTQELSWWQKIKLLLEPENDHRILVPRSIALLDYTIEGFINYRSLIGVVNVSLLGILGFWFLSFFKRGLNAWFFLPLLLWYLTPFVFDVTLWGINGMQHTTLNLLVFCTLALTSYSTSPWAFGVALVVGFAATFTNGNGFLVFPAGLAVLLLAQEWKKSILWILGMVAALLAYFLNYHVGQATKVAFSGEFVGNLLLSFAALSGGWVAAFKGSSPSWLLWGAFVVGSLSLLIITLWLAYQLFMTPQRARKTRPYLWVGVFIFSILTIGIIAVSRGGRDVYSVFTSRYSLYPLHLLTLTYLALLSWKSISPSWVFRIAIIFGGIFMTMSLYQYQRDMDERRRSLMADHYNWRQHRKLITHFRSELADFFTLPAYQKGIYRFDNFPLGADTEKLLNSVADTTQKATLNLTITTSQKKVDFFGHPQTIAQFTLANSDVLQPEFGEGTGVFLVLKSTRNKTYLLPTLPIQGGKRAFLTAAKVYKPGFVLTVYNENFVPDTYRIGILKPIKDGYRLQYFAQAIQVDSLNARIVLEK
jgi:hypothetical protein